MLQAAFKTRRGQSKGQVSTVQTIPAPIGGINARDGFTVMEPTDALTLDNWFPEAQYITNRGGSATWKSGMTNPVRTLLTWRSLAGTDKLIAAAGTAFWDVTASGGNASTVVTGLTNADWQWANFNTSGSTSYLIACNGADSVQNFDGTTWTVPSITGVTSSTLINVIVFKQRVWFAQANTLDLWYLPTASIAGAANKLPIGYYCRKGGYVVGMGTFSRDSGDGPDDYLVAITSNGEAAVFEGIDPASSNTFSLAGIFDVGIPIGRRSMARLNGDLAIITTDGLISMQAMLQFGREAAQKAAFTGKIQTLFSIAAHDYSSFFGWQVMVYPQSRYCIVNYPIVADTQQRQFVMNTVTGAWCTFSNLNAGCWGTANNKLYYGGNAGVVYQAAVNNDDLGATIVCDMKTAWSTFQNPQKKMLTSIKPIVLTSGGVDFQHRVDWDFDDSAPTGTVIAVPATGAVWGSMFWPWTWGGASKVDAQWHGGGGVGVWAAIRFKVGINGNPIHVNAFSALVQPGGAF